jgi:mono/diheme cytochrome c family protein
MRVSRNAITMLLLVLMVGITSIYALFDAQRAAAATQRHRDESIARGSSLFGQYCASCHGPLGEGVVGPALNRAALREGDAEQMASAADLMRKAISRGRAGTTVPSIMKRADGVEMSRTAMPSWLVEEGGALTAQQVDDLVNFIQHGDWNDVLANTGSPDLSATIAVPQGLPASVVSKAETVIRTKGCLSCHLVGNDGGLIGPDLTYVGARRDADYLRRWLKAPSDVQNRGPTMWSGDIVIPMNAAWMPAIPMTNDEMDALVAFLAALK